eukprot:TRINITY_DN744_c0_g1_i3.p3 TRINITY_DN744_c0_g1~~TRINITY_DN744_c0_g1_i3.p3  ORF type:complete len:136 (+),score=15.11 TRINITY_DN744_c0_g1_i3:129-536(+)
MIRRPPRSTHCISSAASDVYKRQIQSQSKSNYFFFDIYTSSSISNSKFFTFSQTTQPNCYASCNCRYRNTHSTASHQQVQNQRFSGFTHHLVRRWIAQQHEPVGHSRFCIERSWRHHGKNRSCLLYTSPSPRDQA